MNQLSEHGCNDDGASSGSPLDERLFVLVGAGGAGKALAFGAKSRGARIVIFDIDFGRNKAYHVYINFNFLWFFSCWSLSLTNKLVTRLFWFTLDKLVITIDY